MHNLFDHDKFALRWRKAMSELVSENAELATKVSNKDKGYGLFNHYDIITEYNNWHAANKK